MTLTLTNIPIELSRALEAEARKLGHSIEQAAIEVAPLSRFSGLWSAEEHAEFERSVAGFEAIDEDLWR